ncbi:hypothetical protein SIN8267_00686 [Sinobacterium norvegicum]|uniref:Lipoprotein n=1 Tax=Sinobacterium norvegicum TaxID=1641715 RepID=A0ABN8EIB0_9GAMM|nr:hypothetical protein [Sinobacterium norvegicum]CAH0990592.1 hypothetical protein SIN8267_00686 [Sinobacterium norvegicum]
MNVSVKTTLLAAAVVVLVGCEKSAEPVEPAPVETATPATESVPGIETERMTVQEGGIEATKIVETSNENAKTAFAATTEIETLSAKVVAVDLTTRDVSLVDVEGKTFDFVAGDEVKNLAQINPGDTVKARFAHRVSIELVAANGQKFLPEETTVDTLNSAKEGEMPGIIEAEKTVTVYTVEAIDLENNTFKLKNIEGGIKQFTAKDPANLLRANIGDAVVVTKTKIFAVEVLKADAEAS